MNRITKPKRTIKITGEFAHMLWELCGAPLGKIVSRGKVWDGNWGNMNPEDKLTDVWRIPPVGILSVPLPRRGKTDEYFLETHLDDAELALVVLAMERKWISK